MPAAARLARTTAATVLGVALAAGHAYLASNAVPASKVGRAGVAIGADTLKPAACSGITLTTTVRGVTGTSGNDLLLGGSTADVMSAGGGNDCVLGGGGKDTIDGGPGTDVCIGGPGGGDSFTNCETTLQ